MLPHGVHDSHGAGFLVEGIPWRAYCSLGIWAVEIRQWDGRFEHAAHGVGVEQEWAELVSEPQAPVRGSLHRLDIEVGAGQRAIFGEMIGDRKGDAFIRVVQLNKR